MPTNYAANPGFETDLDPWSAFAGTTLVRSTAQKHSGVASAIVTSTNTSNSTVALTLLGVVQPGQTWSTGLWVRHSAGTLRRCRADLMYMNDAGQVTEANLSPGIFPPTDGSWVQIPVLGMVAPAGSTRLRLRFVIQTPTAGDAVYIDDAQIVQGSSLEDSPSSSPFTIWNGVSEVPVVSTTMWDGSKEVPILSSERMN